MPTGPFEPKLWRIQCRAKDGTEKYVSSRPWQRHVVQSSTEFQRDEIEDMANKSEGDVVVFRARIHHIRPKSANLAFIVFRQHYNTVQGVLVTREEQVSENMVRWTERLPRETTVLIKGLLQVPKSKDHEVHSATIHQFEVKIEQVRGLAVQRFLSDCPETNRSLLLAQSQNPFRSMLRTSTELFFTPMLSVSSLR